LLTHREEVIRELSDRIKAGTYTVRDYREREINENGKTRRIQILTMKDRIAVHAIMAVVDRHLKKRFIRTTSASIKQRGMHDLLAYIHRDMREQPETTRYCYKFDISKFYESIDQDTVMDEAVEEGVQGQAAHYPARRLRPHD
ncbi:MAG: reverse transcriptase domain-containing protein, partial [Eubacteriales bacterium]|nr:reverse transcriptase domain-containing protein [Eubacteriales bacterium]